MQQTVEARQDLNECAEVDDSRDGTEIGLSDLGFSGKRLDTCDGTLGSLAVCGRDKNGSVIRNIDLRTRLFGDRANRRTALTDDVADLLRIDMQRDDSRSVR